MNASCHTRSTQRAAGLTGCSSATRSAAEGRGDGVVPGVLTPAPAQEQAEVTCSVAVSALLAVEASGEETEDLSPQVRADMACKLVGSVLHESASSVLSSPNFEPHHNHSRQPPSEGHTHPSGHKHTNLTPHAKSLRAEIQILRDTISAKSNENCHNPLLTDLKLQLNQKRKTLKQVYRNKTVHTSLPTHTN